MTDASPSAWIESDVATAVRRAYRVQPDLAAARSDERSQAVRAMAQALRNSQDDILEANTLDLEASRERELPAPLLNWLKLTPERLQRTIALLERLADLSDPIRSSLQPAYPVDRAQTYSQLMPLGTIALVYEAFPELAAIAAGMCLKTGNCAILHGSPESRETDRALAAALGSALDRVGLPPYCLAAIADAPEHSIRELVSQDRFVNLVIPYGRPRWVQQVARHATTPILKAALGNCYLYWSPSGELDVVRWAILESHQSDPDPVNAIEKVLVHRDQNRTALGLLIGALAEKGFDLRGDAELQAEFPDLALAADSEWRQPYLTRTVAFKIANSLDAAIAWIGRYSSGHADCIATESYRESHQFALRADSASVYINASPRFYRNPRGNGGIFLGMSNQKGYRRGPIGLKALTTLKQTVQGSSEL